MKALQVITSLEMGGAETLVVNLIPRLCALGHTVDLCIFNGAETPLMQRLKVESPQTKIYALGHSVYNPIYILKLMKIMKGYDIVHTHNSSPQLFVAIANLYRHRKLISTEHTTSNRKREWKWYAPIESWMYGQYNHVICISRVAEEKLREYMGGDWIDKTKPRYKHISTINNGVDVYAICNATPNNEFLTLKENRKAILMVAGFRDAKDQDTVVKALSSLNKNKFEVWFAGVGERMEEVRQLSESLGVDDRVRFLGLRTDIPNVLKAADIIVMSSHWEGLSLSILFPHEDAKALTNKIKQLAESEEYYDEVANRCYNRALEFDISKTVWGYNNIYTNVSEFQK